MQVDGTVAMLYAQTGYTARAVHDSTTGPETALAMSRSLANEMAKMEQQQVQAPEPSIEARITDNNEQKRQKQNPFGSRRRNRVRGDGEEDGKDSTAATDDPLVGNLLNIQV